MERENLVIAALLLGVLVVAAVVVTYGYYSAHQTRTQQRPLIGNIQLRSDSVDMTGLNSTGLSLNIDAVVYNPNGFGGTLDDVNYSVYANGHFLGSGRTAHEYDLAPQSSLTLTFPVSVGWKPALETMRGYITGLGHVTWEVKGTAVFDLAGLSLSAPFEFTVG